MARQGLQRGFAQGILQGAKTGYAMGNMRTGYGSGITDGTANMDKMQDPTLLTGIKKPLFFCNADNLTTNTGTVITLTDLVGSGFTLTNAAGTNPTPDIISKDIFNLRNTLDFNNAACSLYPTPAFNLSGKSAYSVMMVVKLKSLATTILQIQDLLNPGSLVLQTTDTNQTIRSTLYGGQPGSLTTSVYQSAGLSESEEQDYMILTFKGRLSQPGGTGSEQELHINGTLRKQLVSSNFNIITTSMTSVSTFVIGNDRETLGSAGGGIYLGSFLLLDYWLNESEQLRLENYFRDYYGYKF